MVAQNPFFFKNRNFDHSNNRCFDTIFCGFVEKGIYLFRQKVMSSIGTLPVMLLQHFKPSTTVLKTDDKLLLLFSIQVLPKKYNGL